MKRNIIFSIAVCCSFIGFMGCSSGKEKQHFQPTVMNLKMDSVPDIKIMTEIRVWDNKVYLTYESKGEYGQRHIKQYTYNQSTQTLNFDKELFKKDDGYYQLFAPSLFDDGEEGLYVYDRDMPSVYSVSSNGVANSTGKHLITTSAKTPYSLVQEARQAFYKSTDEYLFIGREPFGGEQALFLSLNYADSIIINEVCKIAYNKDNPSWMINFGKATYNPHKQIVAYTYQLYPIIQLINVNNAKEESFVKLEDVESFNIKIEGADIWEQNPVQFKDITSNEKYIYALFWGKTFTAVNNDRQLDKGMSKITKYDWEGNVIATYTINRYLENIGVSNENSCIIGYDGKNMCLVEL